jgi:phosphohistidine phosphatase
MKEGWRKWLFFLSTYYFKNELNYIASWNQNLYLSKMRLYLLRHAHTEKQKNNQLDFDRSIDQKGLKQTIQLKQNFSELNFSEGVQVLCSDAKRTRDTLDEVKTSIPISSLEYLNELYLPSLNQLLRLIWSHKQVSKEVLIISHNFGISELASYLLDDNITLLTGELIVISCEGVNELAELSKGLGTRYFY